MSASEHGMSTGQTGGQGSLLPFLRTRRERKRRAQEAVGVVWVWDHAEPMTREFAEWAELHLLPLGVSIIRDDRRST